MENAEHFSSLLPGTLGHAGYRSLMRELAQADPAEAELLEHSTRTSAAITARVIANAELLRARLLDAKRFLCHLLPFPSVGREREPKPAQERGIGGEVVCFIW